MDRQRQPGRNQNPTLRAYHNNLSKLKSLQTAQKLSQHFSHFGEDENLKVRWIWELIQNAKDISSGNCNIKIQISDDKFIFSHDGHPFTIQEYDSIISHISSKPQENLMSRDETGKYGTGFVTTYILSKKVRVKGLLSVRYKFEGDEEQVDAFSKIDMLLDRTSANRNEMVEKINVVNKQFEDLLGKQPLKKWDRKEKDFDTQFIFEDLDAAAFLMIENALASLEELFPYAMVFNPKISSLEVVSNNIRKFVIRRGEEEEMLGFQIFNAIISKENAENEDKFSAIYSTDRESSSIVAVPVKVHEGQITLLQVNKKHPKIFKEFPLIGSKDHGFNFVFSSRKFYPNETRSGLLLKRIQGRINEPNIEEESNIQAINRIFHVGRKLYLSLARCINHGKENLFNIVLQNEFTKQQLGNVVLTQLLKRYKDEISNVIFVKFKSGTVGDLKNFFFPYEGNLQESLGLNRVFSPIFGQQRTLDDETYRKFYPSITSNKDTWLMSSIIMLRTQACIQQLTRSYQFSNLVDKFQSEENALHVLHEIYAFLSEKNIFYMTQQRDNDAFKFILTNKNTFVFLNQRIDGHIISVKNNLPLQYQQLAKHLNIDIDKFTIKDEFTRLFRDVNKLGIAEMNQLFKKELFLKYFTQPGNIQEQNRVNEERIIQLVKFMKAFSIQSECIDILSKIRVFENRMDYQIPQENVNMSQVLRSEVKKLFELYTMRYINEKTIQQKTLSNFKRIMLRNQPFFNWWNKILSNEDRIYRECRQNMQIMNLCFEGWNLTNNRSATLLKNQLSISRKFRDFSQMKYFCISETDHTQGNYPNQEDLEFYERMYFSPNSNQREDNLSDQIVHGQCRIKLGSPKTYKQYFKYLIRLYQRVPNYQLDILNYVHRVRESAKRNQENRFKLIFSEIEKKAYSDYPLKAQCLGREEDYLEVYEIVRNQRQISAAKMMRARFNSLDEAWRRLEDLERRERE